MEKPKPIHDFVITSMNVPLIAMTCKPEATDGLSDFGRLEQLDAARSYLHVDARFDFCEVVAYVAYTKKAYIDPMGYACESGVTKRIEKLIAGYKAAEGQPNGSIDLIKGVIEKTLPDNTSRGWHPMTLEDFDTLDSELDRVKVMFAPFGITLAVEYLTAKPDEVVNMGGNLQHDLAVLKVKADQAFMGAQTSGYTSKVTYLTAEGFANPTIQGPNSKDKAQSKPKD